jgi:acetolactate synthase I/II/III large subunit
VWNIVYHNDGHEPRQIAGALQRAGESIAKTGKSAVINIWVDPTVCAPDTMAQTMYK